MYPCAEPDDPLYQRQELGTNPVERISIRTLQAPEGRPRNKIPTEEVGAQTPPRASTRAGEGGLHPAGSELSGQPRGHDPDLCQREPYDYEREKERRERRWDEAGGMGSDHGTTRTST